MLMSAGKLMEQKLLVVGIQKNPARQINDMSPTGINGSRQGLQDDMRTQPHNLSEI